EGGGCQSSEAGRGEDPDGGRGEGPGELRELATRELTQHPRSRNGAGGCRERARWPPAPSLFRNRSGIAQEISHHLRELLGLLEVGEVPALLEYFPVRAGDGVVDLPRRAGRDVEVVAAGDDERGHLEGGEHRPHVVLGEVGVQRLVHLAVVAIRAGTREKLVALLRRDEEHAQVLVEALLAGGAIAQGGGEVEPALTVDPLGEGGLEDEL